MSTWRTETLIGWLLYIIGFLLLFKEIDSLNIVFGLIAYAIGMLFIGRASK